jgi:TPR repeat protein
VKLVYVFSTLSDSGPIASMGDQLAMNRFTLLSFSIFYLLTQTVYADINSANASLAQGDYAAASAEFLRLAEDGDAKAQAHLGYMYYVGEGVQQDYAQAIKWYRKAAVQGDKDAQYNLAVAYAFGEGTKQDYKEAAIWYRRAAEQNHAIAQYSLGISYSYGEGVKQDSAEAVKWFERSAEQGYARSQVQLATKYHTGDGVALNYQEAVKWYRQAADRGNASAQYNLGSMYRSGKGVAQDYNQAVRWYRLAADQGYAAANNELASLERAIAGATRNRNKPNLQPAPTPAPAPVEKVVEQKTPEKEPLLTVQKDELLSLNEEEEEQIEEATLAEAEPMVEAAEEIETAEEKQPGKVSGFFKKFFKKKEAPAEVAMVEVAEPESIEEMQQDSVPVEDQSQPMAESVASEEMTIEREVVSNEPETKKSRFGFFKKLFKKKDNTETVEVEVEDHTLSDIDATDDIDPETVVAYESDEEVVSDEMFEAIDETAEVNVSTELNELDEMGDTSMSTEMDDVDVDEPAKKKGFFKRLFGKKDKDVEQEADTTLTDSSAMTADSIALVTDSPDQSDSIAEEIAADVIVEEEVAMDALETEDKPKKKGFFKRLFGKKDGEEISEDALTESEAVSADSIAMVDDTEIIEEEISIDTSVEDEVAMDALEGEDQSEKKGFFKRLFGKKKDDQEAEAEITESDEEYNVPSADSEFIAETTELEAAQLALNEADYDTAYNIYYDLANKGDATAQYQLGLLYYQGLGIRQNYDEASHWYQQSGAQGNAVAQYSLGNMFLMGEGVSQDDSKAIAWYEKAAEQGHVAAKHNVGNLKRFSAKKSISTDEIESALENEQTEEVMAEGDVLTEEKSKKGFFGRLFGKDDEEETLEEVTPVVQGPLPQIQAESTVEEEVIEVEEEVTEKKKGFFGRLFGKDEEEVAMVEPEPEIAETQSVTSVIPTSDEPTQSFEEALTAVKEYESGLAYSFGDGVAQDNRAAFASFLKSAELGHAPAQYKAGVAYAYGEGVDKDADQALYWYKKAAAQGYVLAQRNLGIMYINGNGIEQNKPLAFAWHSIVADSGNVMDVHRRDSLQQKLTADEIEEGEALKGSLKH